MIKKVLIANRGEIALRVAKTCKRMGIKTVCIFARNDANLPHAKAGDTNIDLGFGALSETYLNQDKIIKICKEHNVDAVHPGYGFLSENKDFCIKLKASGLIFIGPSPESIELMGDKTASKVAMEKLGIPLVPGYHGEDQDPSLLLKEAKKIGFPVLVKATAGGGGKGMRIVESEADFTAALDSSKREALNAFGNDKVLIEKYIINPRHIEVQLVSDGKGNHYHFYERECSIQRRYQKVIEEAPAARMTSELRTNFCQTAVEIAKGINYTGAGTIEFILAPNDEFYFLEMNTRLQVEHPVTEMTTNTDLVELQIIAASGKAFDFKQEDIEQFGHSIECRIYAENPDNDFLPTLGKIQKIQADSRLNYRLDSGYKDQSMISSQYDPMLAKLIVWEEERELAIDYMQDALDHVYFGGVQTNRDYLKRVLAHPKFIEGDIHTHFIKDESEVLEKESFNEFEVMAFVAASLIFESKPVQNIWDYKTESFLKKVEIDDYCYDVIVSNLTQDGVELNYGDFSAVYRTLSIEKNLVVLEVDGEIIQCALFPFDKGVTKHLVINSIEARVRLIPKAVAVDSTTNISEGSLQSPMPGKVFKVIKKVGDEVLVGDIVVIIEAMKMEHAVKANKNGKVSEVFYQEGEQVQGGVALCEIL